MGEESAKWGNEKRQKEKRDVFFALWQRGRGVELLHVARMRCIGSQTCALDLESDVKPPPACSSVRSPHVEVASYAQEHPSKNEILFRCQTSGLISGEQCIVESLELTKDILSMVDDEMDAALARWNEQQNKQAAIPEA